MLQHMALYKKINEIQKQNTYSPSTYSYLLSFQKSGHIYTHLQVSGHLLIFLHMQKVVPVPLSSPFNLSADYHHYSIRQRDNLHNIHSLKYSYSIHFQGPQIWNSIPLSLNTSLSRSNYKVNSKIAICRFNFSSLIQLCLLISQPSFFS